MHQSFDGGEGEPRVLGMTADPPHRNCTKILLLEEGDIKYLVEVYSNEGSLEPMHAYLIKSLKNGSTISVYRAQLTTNRIAVVTTVTKGAPDVLPEGLIGQFSATLRSFWKGSTVSYNL